MPLLDPTQIHQVLKESGIKKEIKASNSELKTLLEQNNLSPSDLLDQLSSIARCGETEATKLKAVEMGLKLNGMLQTGGEQSIPSVTIIINDAEHSVINPILVPR